MDGRMVRVGTLHGPGLRFHNHCTLPQPNIVIKKQADWVQNPALPFPNYMTLDW